MMQHSPEFLKLVEAVMPRVTEITPAEVRRMLETGENFILIDVREDREWSADHIPQAIHLGRGIIERDIEKTVPDKNALLVLYCGGGFRSALAADSLQQMGYTQVRSMSGGWKGWCI